MLRKISLAAAVAACLLIPATAAFARGGGHGGGHGGGWHGHGHGPHTMRFGWWWCNHLHLPPVECMRIRLQQNYPCWNTNHPVDCQSTDPVQGTGVRPPRIGRR